MMTLTAVFWMFLIVFGVIGGFRGWAKEILVVFSMVLALALDWALRKWGPGVNDALNAMTPATQVVIHGGLLLTLAYFGYQTPGLPASLTSKLAKDKLQDWMLGAVLGMINGYFIVGSLWYYLHITGYPFPYVTPPADPDVLRYITYLPPKLVSEQYLVFALIAAFVFVIVVFV